MKKRNLEIPNLENLSKEELENAKVKAEISKIYIEIDEKNKSWFSKNLSVLIPSLTVFATILTGIFTGYFSATSLKLENQKHDLEDSIVSFTQKKDTLNKINISLTQENSKLLENLGYLGERNEFLTNQTSVLSDSTKSISEQLRGAKNQTNQLLKTNKTIIYKEYLSLTKKFPFVGYDFISVLIERLKQNQDFVSKQIEYELKENLSDINYSSISAYILYSATKDHKYARIIENNITKCIALTKLNPIDTLTIANNSLLSVLSDRNWDSTQKATFSKIILENIRDKYCLHVFTNNLINIPVRYYYQNSNRKKWVEEDFWQEYIALNLKCLQNKAHNPKLSDTSNKALAFYDQQKNRYIQYKMTFISNLKAISPQSLFSYFIKNYILYTNNFFIETTPEDEEKTIIRIIFQNFKFYFLDDAILNSYIQEYSHDIENKIQSFDMETGDYRYIFSILRESFTILYKSNKAKIERWLDPEFQYFHEHKTEFSYLFNNNKIF